MTISQIMVAIFYNALIVKLLQPSRELTGQIGQIVYFVVKTMLRIISIIYIIINNIYILFIINFGNAECRNEFAQFAFAQFALQCFVICWLLDSYKSVISLYGIIGKSKMSKLPFFCLFLGQNATKK